MDFSIDLQNFGHFVRARRNALGMTQTELASSIGWTQERISLLENGRYGMPSLPHLCRVAEGLSVPLTAVLNAIGWNDASETAATAQVMDTNSAARLSAGLETATSRLAVIAARLHEVESQFARAEELQLSIRNHEQEMEILLAACKDS